MPGSAGPPGLRLGGRPISPASQTRPGLQIRRPSGPQSRNISESQSCCMLLHGDLGVLGSAAVSRREGVRGIGVVPLDIRGGPVNGRHELGPAQPQPRLHLGAVVAGM